MKRLLFISLLTLPFLSGCAFLKLTPIEYNNRVVSVLNTLSGEVQNSVEIYDSQIPNVVTEKSEVETQPLEEAAQKMSATLEDLKKLSNLTSRSEDQEKAVETALIDYQEATEAYVQAYEGTANYYEKGGYREDVKQVQTIDSALHKAYDDLVESHNHLVEVLASYIEN